MLGNNNDRQALIGFDDGSVRPCVKLKGLPGMAGLSVVAMGCEREQRAWVGLSDGSVYRCTAASGNACVKVALP